MWKSILEELPPANTNVWIRVLFVYSPPVLAQMKGNRAALHFEIPGTLFRVPAYQVARWKLA